MSNIIDFPGITKLNLDPDRTLENTKGKLTGFVIRGYDKEDNEYFASTFADGSEVLWLLERCKKELMAVQDKYLGLTED